MKKYLYLTLLLVSFFIIMVADSGRNHIASPVYLALQQWVMFSPVLILSLLFDVSLVKRILIVVPLAILSSFGYDMWANYEFAFLAFFGIPLFFGLPVIIASHFILKYIESVKFYKTVVTVLVLLIVVTSLKGFFVVKESTARYNQEMQHSYYACKNLNSVSGGCSRFKQ